MMAQKNQKRELYILVVLLAAAALVWYTQFAKQSVASGFSFDNKYTPINAQDFGGIIKVLNDAQKTEYKSTGRNIFVAGAIPPPVDPNTNKPPTKPGPRPQGPMLPPPPPPATLPMKFFGYGSLPSNGPRRAFLQDGDDVHIVGEGEVVMNHIRILHIGNDSIEFEDTDTHQRGSNPIEAAPVAGPNA